MNGKDLIIAIGGAEERYLASMTAQKQAQEKALRQRMKERADKRRRVMLNILRAAIPAAAVFVLLLIIPAVRLLQDRNPAILPGSGTEAESSSKEWSELPGTESATEASADDAQTALMRYLELQERVMPGDYPVSVSHDGTTSAKRCASSLPPGVIGSMTEDLDSDGQDELLLVALEKEDKENESYDGGHGTTSSYIPVFMVCEWTGEEVKETARLSLRDAGGVRTEWYEGYPIYNLWSLGSMTADFFTVRDQGRLLLFLDLHKVEYMFADGNDDAFLCLEFSDDGEGCTCTVRGSGAMSGGYDAAEYLQELGRLGIVAEDAAVPLRELIPDIRMLSCVTYETIITQEEKTAFDRAAGSGSDQAVISGQYHLEAEARSAGEVPPR